MTRFLKRNKKFLVISITIIFFVALLYKLSAKEYIIENLFPEKIWVHRVNSLVKLEEIISDFQGIELDIVWTGKDYDVNHPPAKSIGLSLNYYLGHSEALSKKGIWLDFKNLNQENYKFSAYYLDSILKVNQIAKSNVFVETHSPQYLQYFQKLGFKTSYYLPGGLHQVSKDSVPMLVQDIKDKIKGDEELFISAPFVDYPFMRKHFPRRKKLLWHLGGLYGPNRKFNMYRILFDDNVKVILRPIKSKNGDR